MMNDGKQVEVAFLLLRYILTQYLVVIWAANGIRSEIMTKTCMKALSMKDCSEVCQRLELYLLRPVIVVLLPQEHPQDEFMHAPYDQDKFMHVPDDQDEFQKVQNVPQFSGGVGRKRSSAG